MYIRRNMGTDSTLSARFYEEARLELVSDLASNKRWLARKIEVYAQMKAIYDSRESIPNLSPLLEPFIIHEMALASDPDLDWWSIYGRGDKESDIYGLEIGLRNLGNRIYRLKWRISLMTNDLTRWERITCG